MAVDTKVREELRESFERLAEARARKGTPLSMDHPVGLVYTDKVPVSGSVHLSTGRTITRGDINKRFAKIK